MKIVYLDVLFLTNLIPDYLILRLTSVILGIFVKPMRTCAAALIGGILSVPLYFLEAGNGLSFILKSCLCIIICLVCFGKKRTAAACALFCALSFSFCGAVLALSLLNVTGAHVKNGSVYADVSLPILLVGFVFAYCVLRLVFGQGSASDRKKELSVCASLGNKTVRFKALSDTGNCLLHPFSSKRIMVTDRGVFAELLGDGGKALLLKSDKCSDAFDGLSALCGPRLSLIPYSTAGGSGLMLVLRADKITIDGKPCEDVLLGAADAEIRAGCGCSAVIGV